jgi:hypothetical protein
MSFFQRQLRRISIEEFNFDELKKNCFLSSVELVHTCLQSDDLRFADIFNNDQYKRRIYNSVQLAIGLFSDLDTLNSIEYSYLRNMAILPIKVLYHSDVSIEETEKFFGMFFIYQHKSQCVLEYILHYIQVITKPFLVRIVSSWLDIFSNYFTFIYDKQGFNSDCERIYSYIFHIQDHLFKNLRYGGSFFFFLRANIEYHKDLSIKLHQLVIATAKEVDTWSSDTLHGVMGAVHAVVHHVYIHDQDYLSSLLTILMDKKLQQALQTMLINDETMLVHDITETLVVAINHSRVLFRGMPLAFAEQLKVLYQNVKYILTKLNIFCLLLATTQTAANIPNDFLLIYRDYLKEASKITKNTESCFFRLIRLLTELEKYSQIHTSLLEYISEVVEMVRYHERTINQKLRLLFEEYSVPCNAGGFRRDFEIMKRSQIVLSGDDSTSPQLMLNHLQNKGYHVLWLKDIPDLQMKERCLLQSSCLLFYFNNNYMQYRSELIVAYKNQVSIIPLLTNNNDSYRPTDDFFKLFIESSTLSSKVVYLNNFEQAMAQLSDQITCLGILDESTRVCITQYTVGCISSMHNDSLFFFVEKYHHCCYGSTNDPSLCIL